RLQGVARGRPTRGELDDPCLRLSAMLATVEPDEVVVAGCDCADRAGAAPSSSATAYAPIPAPARPAAARVGAASAAATRRVRMRFIGLLPGRWCVPRL